MSEFKGLNELLKSLSKFPENIQKNVMNGAIRASTKPLVQAVKRNIDKDTGTLRKSIGVVKRKSKDKTKLRFSVTARRGGKFNGWYMHFLEFGTSKMAAKPAFRPAFENSSDDCIKAAREYIGKRLDKEIAKARK